MTTTSENQMAAELLEATAAGYATAAASSLLEDQSIRARYEPRAMASWKSHLGQRLLELAAAVRAGEPGLFSARVVWQKRAFLARESDPTDLPEAIRSLKRTLDTELPENLSRIVSRYLDEAISALDVESEPEASDLDPNDAAGALALKYLAACLEGDARRAIDLVMEARGTFSLATIYLEVLLPAQREIGRMWHAADASVAEERMVSETTRRLMALLSHGEPRPAETGKTVLAAAVASNAHDIGIRAVSDLFEVAGWRVISLGANVPPGDVASAAKFFDVDLIVLAATLSTQLSQLRATIDAVRSSCGDDIKILVGGNVFLDAPDLWSSLGADAYAADVSQAVEAGERAIGLSKED